MCDTLDAYYTLFQKYINLNYKVGHAYVQVSYDLIFFWTEGTWQPTNISGNTSFVHVIHSFDPFFIFPISPSYSISALNCSIIHSSLAQWSQEGWQPNSGDMLSRPWSRHGVVWPWPLHVYKISSSKTHPLYLYKWSVRSRAYENTLKGCRLRTDYGNQFL